jgi:V-type H+-transporting ATPase subunit E
MSLEDIFRALESDAAERCREIQHAGTDRAEAISAESEARCVELVRARLDRAAAGIMLQSQRIVNEARMDRRKAVALAREGVVDDAFDEARKRLGEARQEPGWNEAFARLLAEGVQAAEPVDAVLVDPADEQLAHAFVEQHATGAQVRPELTSAGGAVVLGGGGRVEFDNTLEGRLDRMREDARVVIGELLFG